MSVPICTEQPGTPWFAIGVSFCRPAAAVFDINANGVDALRRLGIDAHRLPLGGVPSMVAEPADRDLDVLFLGGDTERRRAVLATLGPLLWDRHSELRLFRFTEPVHGGVPGLVFGRDKYALLARSRILVNIHRDDDAARLLRVGADRRGDGQRHHRRHRAVGRLRAAARRASHFVESDDIAGSVAELLDDPERCAAIGKAGATAVLDEHPAEPARWRRCSTASTASTWRRAGAAAAAGRAAQPADARAQAAVAPGVPTRRGAPRAGVPRPARRAAPATRRSSRCAASSPTARPNHDLEFTTPGVRPRRDAAPDVSVVVTLYNYADVVTEALDSVVASTGIDFELDRRRRPLHRRRARRRAAVHGRPSRLPGAAARSGEQLRAAAGAQPRHRPGREPPR